MRKKQEFRDLSYSLKIAIITYMMSWIFFIGTGVLLTGTVSVLHLSIAMFLSLLVYSRGGGFRLFAAAYNIFMSIMVIMEVSKSMAEPSQYGWALFVNGLTSLFFLAAAVILVMAHYNRFPAGSGR